MSGLTILGLAVLGAAVLTFLFEILDGGRKGYDPVFMIPLRMAFFGALFLLAGLVL